MLAATNFNLLVLETHFWNTVPPRTYNMEYISRLAHIIVSN